MLALTGSIGVVLRCANPYGIPAARAARATHFALRVKESCPPGRRQHERQRRRLAQHRRAQIEILDGAPTWYEGPVVEPTGCAGPSFVLAAAFDVVEDTLRQACGRELSYVFDTVACPVQVLSAHGTGGALDVD